MTIGGARPGPRLVLASASATRAEMLRRAGIEFDIDPADIDESALKQGMRAAGASAESTAEALAASKAQAISTRHPDCLVIGADQMLECDGRWFDKPGDLDQAAIQLRALAGRQHRLVSSAVAARDGRPVWRATARADLHVRPLGDSFIAAYIAAMGPAILGSVGAYQIEGLGAQLFERIEGDLFTILGMPLLPLLGFLRDQGVLLS